MTNTRSDDEKERHDAVDKIIEGSVKPSPDSAQAIAEKTGEHVTFVVRRLRKRFVWKNGRWVYKHDAKNNGKVAP